MNTIHNVQKRLLENLITLSGILKPMDGHLYGADKAFNSIEVYKKLYSLREKAKLYFDKHIDSDNASVQEKAKCLLDFFFIKCKFKISDPTINALDPWKAMSSKPIYHDANSYYIDKVLETKIGSNLSFFAIILDLSDHLGIPFYPMSINSILFLRLEINDKTRIKVSDYKDDLYLSFSKTKLCEYTIIERFVSALRKDKIQIEDLRRLSIKQIDLACVTVLKRVFFVADEAFCSIDVIQWYLSLYPNNTYELKDRGLMLESKECYSQALEDYKKFIKSYPKDQATPFLKEKIKSLEEESSGFTYN
ncbi:MAG: hypothetical protein R3Y52_01725 [Psittacicella sp.]